MIRTEIRYGLLMLTGFLAFFFTMKVAGLHQQIFLRGFNALIHFGVVFLAINSISHKDKTIENYFNNFLVGVKTSLIGMLPFVIFQFFYLKYLDPAFMQHLIENAPLGDYLTPFTAAVVLFMEGLGATFLSSFIAMHLFSIRKEFRTNT